MKRIVAALAVTAALCFAAHAQTGVAPSSGPAIGAGQVGVPTYVLPAPPAQGGSIIDVGQALGPFLQPYVDALVQAAIAAFVGWLGLILRKKFNIQIDEGSRNALTTALQNQAASLIADGFVKVEQNGKISVDDKFLAASANEIMAVIPDAAKRLGFTPEYLTKRIVDSIPQTAAGAAMIAAATPTPAPAPEAPKPAGG